MVAAALFNKEKQPSRDTTKHIAAISPEHQEVVRLKYVGSAAGSLMNPSQVYRALGPMYNLGGNGRSVAGAVLTVFKQIITNLIKSEARIEAGSDADLDFIHKGIIECSELGLRRTHTFELEGFTLWCNNFARGGRYCPAGVEYTPISTNTDDGVMERQLFCHDENPRQSEHPIRDLTSMEVNCLILACRIMRARHDRNDPLNEPETQEWDPIRAEATFDNLAEVVDKRKTWVARGVFNCDFKDVGT